MADGFFDPTFNCLSQLTQPALKEMIRSLNKDELLWFRQGCDQRLNLGSRTELIPGAADEQFRFRALPQEFVRISTWFLGGFGHGDNRRPHTNERFDSRMRACRPQAHCGSERESGKQEG